MTFPFAPWEEISCSSPEKASVLLLGIPFDGAVCARRGAAQAPDEIRRFSGLLTRFNEDGLEPRNFKLFDAGNEDAKGMKEVARMEDIDYYFKTVESRALEMLKKGTFCLFLGGDHSVSIPLIRAFSRAFSGKKIGILHFDAHPDLMDEYDGLTCSHACTQRRSLELAGFGPGDLALLGVRSFMEEEVAFLQAHPEVKVFKIREIYKKGVTSVAGDILKHFRDHDGLYLSIDIDVLDPAFAPGTGTPDAGGLSTRELLELLRVIAEGLPVKAADIVEVSPPLDHSGMTSMAALKIIYELMAAVLRGRE